VEAHPERSHLLAQHVGFNFELLLVPHELFDCFFKAVFFALSERTFGLLFVARNDVDFVFGFGDVLHDASAEHFAFGGFIVLPPHVLPVVGEDLLHLDVVVDEALDVLSVDLFGGGQTLDPAEVVCVGVLVAFDASGLGLGFGDVCFSLDHGEVPGGHLLHTLVVVGGHAFESEAAGAG